MGGLGVKIRLPIWLDAKSHMTITWQTVNHSPGHVIIEEIKPSGVTHYGPMPTGSVKAFCEKRRDSYRS